MVNTLSTTAPRAISSGTEAPEVRTRHRLRTKKSPSTSQEHHYGAQIWMLMPPTKHLNTADLETGINEPGRMVWARADLRF